MAISARFFLLDRLTCCRKLCNLTDLDSLGSLSAGVGVNLGIEYHNVYVFAGSENVVKTAEADIICPAVAAEDPYGLLGEVVAFSASIFACRASHSQPSTLQVSRNETSFGCRFAVCLAVVHGFKLFLRRLP